MKTKLLIIILIIQSLPSFSQYLDNSFGSGGKIIFSFGQSGSKIRKLKILPDNKILCCGFSSNGTNWFVSLCKLNVDGSFDSSFGTNGKVISNIGNNPNYGNDESVSPDMVIQDDDKIIISGTIYSSSSSDFAMTRYNPNGTLDNTFGNNGTVVTDFNNDYDVCKSMILQSDGKIILAGTSKHITELNNFGVARYNIDGTLDTTFGTNGTLSLNLGSQYYSNTNDNATSIKLQSSGKLVIGGYADKQDQWSFPKRIAVIRLNLNGTLDASFGVNGKSIITSYTGLGDEYLESLIIGNNDEIIVGGHGYNNSISSRKPFIGKFDINGQLQTSFGTNGFVIDSNGGGRIFSLSLRNDKIFAIGNKNMGTYFNYDFMTLRYNYDGSLDTSFDLDGVLYTNFGTDNTYTTDKGFTIAHIDDNTFFVGGQDYINCAIAKYGAVLNNQNYSDEKSIVIYPNPVNSILNIQNNTNYQIDKIKIIDTMGKTVYEQNLFITEINIEKLQKGFYFIEFVSENKTLRYKFIKN